MSITERIPVEGDATASATFGTSPSVSRRIETRLSLCLLALQFGAQPFLVKQFVHPGTPVSSLVLVSEVFKVLTCVAALQFQEGGLQATLRGWTWRGFLLAAGCPSVTYLVQNVCIQNAYRNLDSVVFNILNQTKTLFGAFFVFLFIGRAQSRVQCVSLCLITIAGVLASQSESSSRLGSNDGAFGAGVIFILIGSLLSGFGAGLTEWTLTGQNRDNYLLSAEMALLGVVILSVSLLLGLSPDATVASSEGLFANWSPLTVVPVITQGLGGLLVGKVTKLVGTVQKGFAVTVGLVFSCVIRCLSLGQGMPVSTSGAVVLVGMSIYLHAAFPVQKAKSKAA